MNAGCYYYRCTHPRVTSKTTPILSVKSARIIIVFLSGYSGSFKTSSAVAADALQPAKQLLRWCQEAANEAAVNEFCGSLVADLSEPFAADSGRRPLVRENLWKV